MLAETEMDRVLRYYPLSHCPCDGSVVLDRYRRHQVFDLPEVKFSAVEHRSYQGTCEICGKTHHASLPDDVPSGQMGAGLILPGLRYSIANII